MRSLLLGSALALAGNSYAQQAQSKQVCDAATKICTQSYTDSATGITVGIALPQTVTPPYDAIISITSPKSNTWVGFAWGGTMVWNPLTVAWPNGNSAVVSSRFAYSISLPQGYDGAEYKLLKGTMSNSTHWTMNAVCSGCTSWISNDDSVFALNGTGTVEFAWAQGTNGVENSANNGSAFNVHAAFGKWTHDLGAARSSSFSSWVSSNLLAPAAPSATAPAATSTAAKPSTTIVTSVKPSSTKLAVIPASCSGAGSPSFQGTLASGWKATKVLGGLTSPRQIVFDTKGNMLVVQAGKGISYHVMTPEGCVSSTKMLISQNNLNHGIALSVDGKTLYASSMTQAYSWPYNVDAGTLGTRSTIITGMYNGGSHLTRTLAIAPHQPNILLVSHGSNDNWDYATGNPKTGRSVVRAFDVSKVPSAGYNYVNDGYLMGYGMRNEVGICFDANNMLWGVENSGDNFQRTPLNGGAKKDIHQNNPGEKLHYIGDVTKPNNNWYGYPTCFAVWNPSDFTDAKFQIGDHFVVSPNNTFKDENCKAVVTAPSLVFQPHSAPIDCKFDQDSQNLFVSFHGSWNRQPTTGFKLVVVPFTKGSDGAYKPTAPLNTQTGYQDVFYNPDVTKCAGNGPSFSSGCFRPAGLMFDSQQRLYMTSDTSSNGEVWVLGKS
ncbi:cellulose binding iron reductase-like protein [Delitschia confertaspora ATCC 74209]|uniref:Cellulose binding iron reductase-like protein n=1 Tax=Delitschia confertaspora ATCC 74209 TaxID=1513339 RepID=A0A9P4JC03_9PLEO|nr:cellulose binding iron reductase-like protein [Delitschia confertaspora ATCC 74209]